MSFVCVRRVCMCLHVCVCVLVVCVCALVLSVCVPKHTWVLCVGVCMDLILERGGGGDGCICV